jgi:hypothetical protein
VQITRRVLSEIALVSPIMPTDRQTSVDGTPPLAGHGKSIKCQKEKQENDVAKFGLTAGKRGP